MDSEGLFAAGELPRSKHSLVFATVSAMSCLLHFKLPGSTCSWLAQQQRKLEHVDITSLQWIVAEFSEYLLPVSL